MKQIISVIMPVYNGDKYLERAIESFVRQKYSSKELIIVDGKSTDNSHAIIQRYVESNPEIIKWIKQNDSSLSEATNIGISASNGEIIGFLGADDLLYEDSLFENIHNNLIFDFDAIYFNSYTFYINDKRCVLRKPINVEFTKENLLRHGTLVGLQNIYFRKHIFNKYKYNPNNKYSLDYEFYLEISKEKYLYVYVDQVATINVFDENISFKKAKEQSKEAYEIAKVHCVNNGEMNIVENESPFRESQDQVFPKNRLKRFLKKLLQKK